jgi:DNA-binding beta-propeller fold protein YncE
LISFHGGEGPDDWNNLHAYDKEGNSLGKVLDTSSLPAHIRLRELRGFVFDPHGDLYVTNAWQGGSHVLRFAGQANDQGRHEFVDVFVDHQPGNPGLSHPFDVTFGPDGHLFIPSQDTNVVGRYFGPTADTGTAGTPMPVPVAVRDLGIRDVLPGTYVPSKHHADHGLSAVRGSVFDSQGRLYVVDRDDNAVKAYDGQDGKHIRSYHNKRLGSPIHLLPHPDNQRMLVGSRDRHAVVSIDLETGDMEDFVAPHHGGLHSPSGMAIGTDRMLYVGSRDAHQVLRYDLSTGKADHNPFIDKLHDAPEFLRLSPIN